MPNDLFVPSAFPTIRDAITNASSEDNIIISSGTYDIRDAFAVGDLLGPATFSYTTNINCMTGFELVTILKYKGAGSVSAIGPADATYVSGNPRLFTSNQDGVAPVEIYFEGLQLEYNSTESNYILQTGNFGVSEADTLTKIISLSDISFEGTYVGNTSANGNYSAVLGIESFSMSDCHIGLTGQFSFIGTQADSGGSSFMMIQGGLTGQGITFSGNFFDESGYRNGVSVFDSGQAVLSNNTFYRSDVTTRYRRKGSEKFKNTSGSVTSNRFYDGSYITIEKDAAALPTQQVVVTGNRFAQFDPLEAPVPIIGGGAVGIVLQGPNADTALFQPSLSTSGNFFDYVTPLVNPTASTIQLGVNNAINPVNNISYTMNAIFTGGTGNDTIIGSNNNSDYLTGGPGNDFINTGTGGSATVNDLVLFNTPLNSATNVDTVTNFFRATNGTAVDRIILDRSVFKDITATYAGSTPSAIGAVNAINIQNGTGAIPLTANARIIYQTTTGNLYYDQDGIGTTYPTTLFAKIYSSSTATTPIPGIIGYTTAGTLANVNIGII